MHIRYIVSQFPKISETFILDQISYMLDSGNDVDIYSRTDPCEDQTHSVVNRYNLINKTTYAHLSSSSLSRLVSLISRPQKIVDMDPEKLLEGIHYFKYGRDVVSFQLLHLLMRYPDEPVDLVHSHFGPNGNVGAALKQAGVIDNLVVSFHGSDIEQPYWIKNRYRSVFKQADRILVNSNYNVEKLLQMGCPPEKTVVHPVSVDISRFQYRWKELDPTNVDSVVILSIGRLSREKNHKQGIHAVKEIQVEFQNYDLEYRIIGSGPERQRLQDLTHELGLEDTVHLLGERSAEEVAEQIGEAHIFLHTSIREGFGKVLLEAQAGGLPIVTTDAGGILDAVNRGDTALVCSKDSKEEMVENLQHLLANRSRWETMGQMGRQYVKKNFESSILNEQLHEIYLDILAE